MECSLAGLTIPVKIFWLAYRHILPFQRKRELPTKKVKNKQFMLTRKQYHRHRRKIAFRGGLRGAFLQDTREFFSPH